MLGGSSGVFALEKKHCLCLDSHRFIGILYLCSFLNSSLVEDHALIHHPPTPTPSTGKSSTKVTKLAYLLSRGLSPAECRKAIGSFRSFLGLKREIEH